MNTSVSERPRRTVGSHAKKMMGSSSESWGLVQITRQ
jgi:hypothetical protein